MNCGQGQGTSCSLREILGDGRKIHGGSREFPTCGLQLNGTAGSRRDPVVVVDVLTQTGLSEWMSEAQCERDVSAGRVVVVAVIDPTPVL